MLLYKYVVTCLHSMGTPDPYPLLTEAYETSTDEDNRRDEGDMEYEDWNWDRETVVKSKGLKCSLTSATHATTLVVLKKGLLPVKVLSFKRASDMCMVTLTL